jgi:probable HAF family extracellular repeat protein
LAKADSFSVASDMNDSGDVAGFETTLSDVEASDTVAVVWRKNKPIRLDSPGGGSSRAMAINNDGAVAGYVTAENGLPVAVLWTNDEPRELGSLGGGSSQALDVNGEDQVVGYSSVNDRSGIVPFIFENGEMRELSLPDGLQGYASEINDSGLILGTALEVGDDVKLVAVAWENETVRLLPGLEPDADTIATAVNEAGQIVGSAATDDGGHEGLVAVLWDGDEVIDLNTQIPAGAGFTLISATGINEAGQILADATASDGSRHGVLLTPSDESSAKLSRFPSGFVVGAFREV